MLGIFIISDVSTSPNFFLERINLLEKVETGGNAHYLLMSKNNPLATIECQFTDEKIQVPIKYVTFAIEKWKEYLEENKKAGKILEKEYIYEEDKK